MSDNDDYELSLNERAELISSEVECDLKELYITLDFGYDEDRELNILKGISKILESLDRFPYDMMHLLTPFNRARLFYQRGKALAASPESSDGICEDLLSRAIKLAPEIEDAWNTLGAALYSKKDFIGARRCFDEAISLHGPSKISCRRLSMTLRAISPSIISQGKKTIEDPSLNSMSGPIRNYLLDSLYDWTEEEDFPSGNYPPMTKADLLIKSVELAKQSLNFDLYDPLGWYVLGNAYTASFFAGGENGESSTKNNLFSTTESADTPYKTLRLALSAYSKATELLAKKDLAYPDVFLNRATIYGYLGKDTQALDDLENAYKYEPCTVIDMAQPIINLIIRARTIISRGIGGSRLDSALSNLRKAAMTSMGPKIDSQSRLGGKKSVSLLNSASLVEMYGYRSLAPGWNPNRSLLCSPICMLGGADATPLVLLCLDVEGMLFAGVFYNLDSSLLEFVRWGSTVLSVMNPCCIRRGVEDICKTCPSIIQGIERDAKQTNTDVSMLRKNTDSTYLAAVCWVPSRVKILNGTNPANSSFDVFAAPPRVTSDAKQEVVSSQ